MRLGVSANVIGKAGAGTSPTVPLGYAGTVQSLGGLVSYWRLSSTSAISDAVGGSSGTYSGTVTTTTGLPADTLGNAAINFAGTGTGTIPHSSAFLLSAFTLSLWVKPNSIPAEEDPDMPLFAKDSDAATLAGDFDVGVHNMGVVQARFRDASGTVQSVSSAEDTATAGTATHIAVTADGSGFSLYVAGRLWGTSTAYTGAWSANTQNILLADHPNFMVDGDCILDEIALYNRVLTQVELLALAQSSTPPVAEADTAAVPESTATTIDVVTNDTFVGTKADLTVTIIAQPAGGDSVAVDGNNDITYTAGAVSANTNRSFQYRITDALGVSNTATVAVQVQNSADPPPTSPQANCFTINTTDTVTVTTSAQLQTQINAAPPGRTILLGTSFSGGTLTLSPAGTVNNPIVVRPSGARNTVTISAPNWTLATGSSRIVFYGINFTNPQINVNGSRHRFTRCQFRDVQRRTFLLNSCTDLRIDHCDVSDWANSTASKEIFTISNGPVINGSFRRLLFDYNYIHDITNTIEPSTVGFTRTTSNDTWRVNSGVTIDHCLFLNNTVPGQGEFIVVKHSGFKVRFCTFKNQSGYLQQRTGGGWEVRSCWFENMGRTSCLQCWDDYEGGTESGAGRQLVIGNRLVGGHQIWIGAGNLNGIETVDGLPVPNPYSRSRLGQFIGNIVGGGIRVGEMWSNDDNIHPALANNIFNNTGTVTAVNASGTTTQNPAVTSQSDPPTNTEQDPWYEFEAAEELLPADVGLGAADPLCPSGPQS